MTANAKKVSCIILAGGEGKRVGGADKGLIDYQDKPLVGHVIDIIAPQVDDIVISANRNTSRYQQYSVKVISDDSERYLGPMAGISAALPHCQHDWVLIVACDTPFLPVDIVDNFFSARSKANLYIASSNDRLHLVMLVHKSLHGSINHALTHGQLRLMQWARSHQPEIVNFTDDVAFKNFNNHDDFHT